MAVPSCRRRVLLVVAATLGAVLLAEVALRVWGASTGAPGPAEFLVRDEQLGWRNRPGYRGRHVAQDFDVAVCFDRRGGRIGAAAAAAPTAVPAAAPVLALGDSTTFGWGVDAEQAFAALLGARLGVEVCNLGVTGYGTDQQLLLLREVLASPAADGLRLVAATHTANDVDEVLADKPYHRSKPRFVADGERLSVARAQLPADWFDENCHLWRTAKKHLGGPAETASPAATQRGRELVRLLYRAMHRECAAKRVQFLLVVDHAEWLREAAAQDGVPCLDLTTTFAALERSGPTRFAHDPHWLPRLHEAVAEQLARCIGERRLLGG